MTNVKISVMLFGMTEHATANTPPPTGPNTPPAPVRAHGTALRLVPPVAALGTAFVLQVVLITDTVGTALANRTPGAGWDWSWYLLAAVLGLAVASCVEGGAAYLMDLYDKHLLARDNVWALRLGMFVYVAGSGAAVHWWTTHRDLPELIGWLLAGMSASALFLWSRGSRWQNRTAMRAAGQLDPAMPRLAAAAKFWHPVRWLITTYLISWEPAATTDEARQRYEQWRGQPHWWRKREQVAQPNTATRPAAPIPAPVVANTDLVLRPSTPNTVVPISGANGRRRAVANTRPASAASTPAQPVPSIEQMAAVLRREHGRNSIGRPKAEHILRGVFGSCTSERARQAKDLHNARLAEASDDDREDSRGRELVGASA